MKRKLSLLLRAAQNDRYVALGGKIHYGDLCFDSLSFHVVGDTAQFEMRLIPADEAYLDNQPTEEDASWLFQSGEKLRKATLRIITPESDTIVMLPFGR